jgi:hypothetical protein
MRRFKADLESRLLPANPLPFCLVLENPGNCQGNQIIPPMNRERIPMMMMPVAKALELVGGVALVQQVLLGLLPAK